MDKDRLTRISIFVGRAQLECLRHLSAESDVPIAAMIRRGIDLILAGVATEAVGLGRQAGRLGAEDGDSAAGARPAPFPTVSTPPARRPPSVDL